MSSIDKATIRVGTRRSQLALVQTNLAIEMLKRRCPRLRFEVVEISTVGDKILDVALSKIGDKSLFTKELEVALLNKEVDFVVHSLKDVPTSLPPGLVLGCVFDRASPDDVVLMSPANRGKRLCDLPNGSIVGTSALRRVAALRRTYSQLKFISIRGNLNTRLKKLDQTAGPQDMESTEKPNATPLVNYDAIILAKAGIERLGWSHRIDQILSDQLHAVSQGALACECRQDDEFILSTLSLLHSESAALSSIAERALMRHLDGGCSTPIGVRSHLGPQTGSHPWFLSLTGCVMSLDGDRCVQRSLSLELPHQVPTENKHTYSVSCLHEDGDNSSSPTLQTLDVTTTCDISDSQFRLSRQTEQSAIGSDLTYKSADSERLDTSPTSEELQKAENPDSLFMGVYVKPLCSVARLRMARAESLGCALGDRLLAAGADQILKEIRANNMTTAAGSSTRT